MFFFEMGEIIKLFLKIVLLFMRSEDIRPFSFLLLINYFLNFTKKVFLDINGVGESAEATERW